MVVWISILKKRRKTPLVAFPFATSGRKRRNCKNYSFKNIRKTRPRLLFHIHGFLFLKEEENRPGCYCKCNFWKKAKNIVKILFSKVVEKPGPGYYSIYTVLYI